ncbi:hypothetical protein JCM10213_002892 [Rhodosporidiobolus nylandii]
MVTANQVIYYLKKAFKLFKKAKKHYDQQQAQHGAQQQQQGGTYAGHAGQQHGGAWGGGLQSPYPPVQQQPQGGAWNQGHGQAPQGGYGGKVSAGGYGAHDGPATRLPLEVVELATSRIRRGEAETALSRRWRLTPSSPLVTGILSPTSSTISSPRAFSTSTLALIRRPFRVPFSFYDPSTRFTYASPPRQPKPPPPPPPSTLIPLTIFSRIPSYLRPSYRTILELVGWDRLVAGIRDEQNQYMANAQNAHYVELRNNAIREGDMMAKAFASSKQAYSSGNGGAAHELSQQGKEHQRNKDRFNAEAAEWIYQENNRTQPPGSIDLHGLYVQEAIDYTERAIAQGRQQGWAELKVIVGKGNHSPSHVAKIKPAITSLMERERLTAHLDPHNGGVLIVQLQGQGGGRSGGQFVREMEQSSGNDCVVM